MPAPASVHETIKELLDSKDDYYLFGYTSAQGDADTRAAVAAEPEQTLWYRVPVPTTSI